MRVVDADSDEPTAIVAFERVTAHMFGPPNDEAFHGHPLASRGLKPYAAFRIEDSSWVRRLERMNRVHRQHDKKRYMAGKQHFIFAFHDSTFECIARGLAVESHPGPLRETVSSIVARLS